jgi:hypothetical protein
MENRMLEIWKGQARLKRERLEQMLAQQPPDLRAAWLREDWLTRAHQNLETRKKWLQVRLENVTAVLKIMESGMNRKQRVTTPSNATARTTRKKRTSVPEQP